MIGERFYTKQRMRPCSVGESEYRCRKSTPSSFCLGFATAERKGKGLGLALSLKNEARALIDCFVIVSLY